MARKRVHEDEDRVGPKKPPTKYMPVMPVKIYRMLRAGMTESDVCSTLNISRQTYYLWYRTKEEVRYAVDTARKELDEGNRLPDWIYQRMSPDLKKVWEKLERLEQEENGVNKIEMLLLDHGKKVRQQIFIHALCMNQFSPSYALKKANIPRTELQRWINEDQDFAKLIEEIQWHKANFFEERLVKLIEEGNVAATIFANKTLNRDRGYAPPSQIDVNHRHSGTIQHNVLDLAELLPYMNEDVRIALMEAIRRKEEVDVRKAQSVGLLEAMNKQIENSVPDALEGV